MSLQVRLAARRDMDAVYALRHEVFVVGQDVPEELERDEHDGGCEHAVAVSGGAVVGTGRLVPPALLGRDDGRAVVGRMAVAGAARRRGVGSALLALLERRAAERGFAGVELHAQCHAEGFYARAGYRVLGEPYDEAGIAHVTMRKDLPAPGADD